MSFNHIIDIIIVILIAWLVYLQYAPVKGLATLREDEFRTQLDQSRSRMLIDVREAHELKNGIIPGAVNIPLSQLANRIGGIQPDREIFLYCRSGMRSKRAARMLSRKGVRKLAHLRGGIGAWSGKRVNP